MNGLRILPTALVAAAAAAALPATTRAAEGYDNCTGFISSLPATITTQGTWCFDKDLQTAAASGAAIGIGANNVTIDCNGFKLGNLAAGPGSLAAGIVSANRSNVTIRNCHVRGFAIAVQLLDVGGTGGGHVVENNRIEGAGQIGILVHGDHYVVRDNQLYDIGFVEGGLEGTTNAISAHGSAEITGNKISGLTASGTSANAIAIVSVDGATSLIRRNVIRDTHSASGGTWGIYILNAGVAVRDNDLIGPDASGSTGITCAGADDAVRDNIIGAWQSATTTCSTMHGNLTY